MSDQGDHYEWDDDRWVAMANEWDEAGHRAWADAVVADADASDMSGDDDDD